MLDQTPHVHDSLADYVLGLLADAERRHVEAHTAVCLRCRQALDQQRLLRRHVRETVLRAGAIDVHNLRRLMPPPPRRSRAIIRQWRGQLAGIALLLLLLIGGYALRGPESRPALWPGPPPTALSATATATTTPTATATQLADPPLPDLEATPVALAPLLH